MSTYGLTVHDLNYSKQKITKQRDFLKKNTFTTKSGQSKSLLDISFAANHSERYYAQVLNKVHTMDSYNFALGHLPIFMTVTLDAPFHEMLEGKFEKFYKKYKIYHSQIINLETGEVEKNLVPNNDRYGYLIDAIEEERRLSVKDLYRILSFQLHGFQMSYIFKKLKKEGNEVSYLRVTEPMKSGVPHFHLLLYTKEQYIKGLYDSFHKYFSAPQNKKPLSYKNNKRVCTKPLPCGTHETQGFQWDIGLATGYVLKYVLKSFRNVKNDDEIDYLQAWYINNRIPRMITSRTLVPHWVYFTMHVIDKDWYYQSDLKSNHFFECDSVNKTFEFHDYDFNKKIIYDNGYFAVYWKDRLIKTVGKKKFTVKKIRLKSCTFSVKKPSSFSMLHRYEIYTSPLTQKPKTYKEQTFEDDSMMMTSENSLDFMLTFLEDLDEPLMEKVFSFSEMSNLSLLELYNSNKNYSVYNSRHYSLHNELVSRGLIYGDYLNLNDGTKREKIEYFESASISEEQERIFNQIGFNQLKR